MIPEIKELNFPPYATLHQATVTLDQMGDKTITTQVKIDGNQVPSFIGTNGQHWAVEFRGEKYILPITEPQAKKSNESSYSLVDLTFYNNALYDLKRYYFVELASTNSGTAIADKYEASLSLNLANFCTALQNVMDFYGLGIKVNLNPKPNIPYSTAPVFVNLSYTYIWDVLQNVKELFDANWYVKFDSETKKYSIEIGYTPTEITHTFEYGFKGGLLSFERQVQSAEIKNVILGRGGEKNLPRLYFKDYSKYTPTGGTWDNGEFAPDPDAIPELVNIYFDKLRDYNFRLYVQGWAAGKKYSGHTYNKSLAQSEWAYSQGYTDAVNGEKFAPVEYVKDDDSILQYGEWWGSLEANDDIYPSIQGVTVDPYGRIDEVVAVEQVVDDDVEASVSADAVKSNINGISRYLGGSGLAAKTTEVYALRGAEFDIPAGQVGNIDYTPYVSGDTGRGATAALDPAVVVNYDKTVFSVVDASGKKYPASGIPAGHYHYEVQISVTNASSSAQKFTYGVRSVTLTSGSGKTRGWLPTFDIWVKNIWSTSKNSGESDTDYADRVWRPVLGDKSGESAKVVFSDGWLSVSSDYEFEVVGYAYDTSKTFNGVKSEWRLTLQKSDAEYEATKLYVPNAQTGGNASSGDHFFFIGIDMNNYYVQWAEKKLRAYKIEKGLGSNSSIKPTWVVTLDKVRAHTPDADAFGKTLVDQIEVGNIVNIFDKRFTDGKILQLYVQTVTYTWSEVSNEEPCVVPDVQIVLSDDIVATKSAVQTLQGNIDSIKQTYVSVADLNKAIETICDAKFLRKSGIADISYSPTLFSAQVSGRSFSQGEIGGTGWGFYKDGEGNDILEADKVVVRKELSVNNLVINQISYVGGSQIVSAAAMECIQVDDTKAGYVCHFNQRQGSVVNLFVVGDVAYSQRFEPDGSSGKYYKRKVVAVDSDSITLSKTVVNGSGVPMVGDVIIQFGHYTDTARQYVMIRNIVNGGYERMLSSLNSVNASGSEYYFAGRESASSPRWFVGSKSGNYAEYQNGKLTIKGDLELIPGSDLDDRISGVETNLNDAQDDITAVKGDISKAQADVNRVQGAVDRVQGDVNTVSGQVDTVSKDLDTAKGEITAVQGGLDAANTNISQAQQDITAAQGDISKAQEDIVAADNRITDVNNDLTGKIGDVQDDIDAANGKIDDLSSNIDQYKYLKDSLLDGAGVFASSKGILLSTFIGVRNDTNVVVAGMNASGNIGFDGSENGHGRLMLFAGSSGVENAGTARFKVYADGHMVAQSAEIHGTIYASDGEFTGKINASSGKIGVFDISTDGHSIKSETVSSDGSNYGVFLSGTSLVIQTGHATFPDGGWLSSEASLTTTPPATAGIKHVLSVFRSKYNPYTGESTDVLRHTNIAMKVEASGAAIASYSTSSGNLSPLGGSFAVWCDAGMFAGLRPINRTITAGTTLTPQDHTVLINNTSTATIYLPSDPLPGQEYEIIHKTTTRLTISAPSSSRHQILRITSTESWAYTMDSSSREIIKLVYMEDVRQSTSYANGSWVLTYFGK